MNHRPIDALNEAMGKTVMIKLKNNKKVSGTLKALDMHMNMWLLDAEVTDADGNTQQHETFLIRGDNVIFVSPPSK